MITELSGIALFLFYLPSPLSPIYSDTLTLARTLWMPFIRNVHGLEPPTPTVVAVIGGGGRGAERP